MDNRRAKNDEPADLPWDSGCKLGFFMGEHAEVWEKFYPEHQKGRPMPSSIWLDRLPAGWKPIEGGITGAAGYYIVFEVEVLPTIEDGRAVRRLLNRMKTRRCAA